MKTRLTMRGDQDFRCFDVLGDQDGEVLDVRGIVPLFFSIAQILIQSGTKIFKFRWFLGPSDQI